MFVWKARPIKTIVVSSTRGSITCVEVKTFRSWFHHFAASPKNKAFCICAKNKTAKTRANMMAKVRDLNESFERTFFLQFDCPQSVQRSHYFQKKNHLTEGDGWGWISNGIKNLCAASMWKLFSTCHTFALKKQTF